jgi:spoIIIJ-associated protein
MEWVETTGRTIAEAKDHALDQLGVDESDAEFEIMEEPRPGLFGRIRGEARVRARVRPTQPRPKAERRDRRKRRDESGDPAAIPVDGEIGPSAKPPARGARTPAGVGSASARRSPTRTGDDGAASATPAASAGSGHPSALTSRVPAQEETTMTDQDRDESVDSRAEVEEAATAFLTGLLDAFGLEGEVTVEETAEGELEASIEGSDLGLLVGPKGQTLLAVQDLTRLVAQRHLGPGSPRLAVDVGGYRHRRIEALQRFSAQLADQVRDSGTPKALEPMTAADRKVVHDALNDRDGVSTISEGEEPYRRVVIVPEAG